MQPPFVNLGPGSTGTQVDQLQKWLVSLGYLSQADYNTGPGTYGPKTTAAVTKLQQSLGVNNSTGPGYWGPQTISTVQSDFGYKAAATSPTSTATATPTSSSTPASTSTPAPSSTSSASSGGNLNLSPVPTSQAVPGSVYAPAGYTLPANGSYITIGGSAYQVNGNVLVPASSATNFPKDYANAPDISTFAPGASTAKTATPQGLQYDPSWAKYGITSDIFSQMNAVQQAQVATALAAGTQLYSSTGGKVTLDQALQLAATDPNIISKYADAAKLDTQAFQQSLQQIQTATSTTAQQQKTQFENERKQLADASAAAGQAYSGFRGKAEQDLAQNETGIVTSTRAQLQKNLQDLTTSFESKYGSAAATAASASYADPFASSNISLSGQYSPTTTPASNVSGTLAGGVTGSQTVAKANDITSTAANYVNLGQTPNVIQP